MNRPLLLAAGGFCCFGVFWGSWAVSTTDIERFTGLSNAGIGILLSASIAVGGLVAAGAGGPMARIGAGRMLPALLLPWGVCATAAALVPGRTAFVAIFALTIACAGLVDMAMNTVATISLGGEPGGMVRFHSLFNAGTLLGAGLVAGFVAGKFSWRWTWLVVGVGALALAVVAFAWQRSTEKERIKSEDERAELTTGHEPSLAEPPLTPSVGPKEGSMLHSFAAIGKEGLVVLAATFAVTAVVEGGIDTWGVLYLRTRLATGVLLGAGAYAVGQLIAAMTRATGAPLLSRLGHRHGLVLGSGLAAVGLAAEAISSNAALAACALAVAAGGISLCWPLTMARLASISDAGSADHHVRTTALVGGFTAAGYFGWLLGPAVVGTVSDHAGLRAGLLLLAGLSAAACATLAGIQPRAAAR
ncbi:MAG: MFS transporter [Acidimicrobiales bacterium]